MIIRKNCIGLRNTEEKQINKEYSLQKIVVLAKDEVNTNSC